MDANVRGWIQMLVLDGYKCYAGLKILYRLDLIVYPIWIWRYIHIISISTFIFILLQHLYPTYININILHTSTLVSIPSIALISILFQHMYPCNINICIHPISSFISALFESNVNSMLTPAPPPSNPNQQATLISFLYELTYPFYIKTFISILFNSITLLSFLYQHYYPSFLYKHICIHSTSTFVSLL